MLTKADKKIAKNSMILYAQMFLGMLIGFYTSRVVLDVLGIEDFGLYNVIGGVVAMFTVLNSAMSSSSSRFLTFEIGTGDEKRLKQVFGATVLIHLGIALLIALLAIPIGLWFMKSKMQIDVERLFAGQLVFYASVITACTSVMMVPFQAIIIAHEKMSIFAYFSIIELLAKLAIVLILPLLNVDKLICYAFLLLLVHLLMQCMYFVYCRNNFIESRGGLIWEKGLVKEMSSFAGWSLFGDAAALMMTQGVNILLNMFFGAGVNAARGVSVQVQSVLERFIRGFQTALNPQIVKRYAARELKEMHKLIYASSRYSFYVLLIVSLPVFLEMNEILNWWLKEVPEHTTDFLRIMIVISLVDCLANPLIFAAKATGRIRRYQALLGGLLLCIVPVSYIFLKYGYPAEIVFIVHLTIALLGHVVRVILISSLIFLSIKSYLKSVIVPCLTVVCLGALIPYFYTIYFTNYWVLLLLSISVLWMMFIVVVFGMNRKERSYVFSVIKNRVPF